MGETSINDFLSKFHGDIKKDIKGFRFLEIIINEELLFKNYKKNIKKDGV